MRAGEERVDSVAVRLAPSSDGELESREPRFAFVDGGGREVPVAIDLSSVLIAQECNKDVQDETKCQIFEKREAGNDPKGLHRLRVPHREGPNRRWQEARRPSELIEPKVGIERSEKRASTDYVE